MNGARIIGPGELRANPALIGELRAHPGEAVERRFAPLARVELRAKDEADDGGVPRMGGLAAVFDRRSENLGGFVEQIAPGAFSDVLEDDVRFLVNHDPNLLLARTTAGTLTVREVDEGLEYEADPAPTSYARDLATLMERGEVSQSSFAFRVAYKGDEWDEDPDTGLLVRTITRFAALYDVSAVTYPAYPDATSGLRAAAPDADRVALRRAQEARERDLRIRGL